MLVVEITAALVAAGRALSDISQEVQENHRECKIIRNLVAELSSIVSACITDENDAPKHLTGNLSDTVRYIDANLTASAD